MIGKTDRIHYSNMTCILNLQALNPSRDIPYFSTSRFLIPHQPYSHNNNNKKHTICQFNIFILISVQLPKKARTYLDKRFFLTKEPPKVCYCTKNKLPKKKTDHS